MTNFNIAPLKAGIAAEITGLDCGQPFSAATLHAIKQAFADYPVLVFRDQTLTPPQLAAFGRHFGTLESYGAPPLTAQKPAVAALAQTGQRETPDQMLYVSPDDPDVLIMTNEMHDGVAPIGIVDNAEMWHSDASHKTEPYLAIITHVLQNPRSGGDTEFCDMRAVYEALTPDIQKVLHGRVAFHHWSKSVNPRFDGMLDEAARKEGEHIARMIPEMPQPLVRAHPDTGRPSLYLSPRFTLRVDGVSREMSDMLLKMLFAFAEDPCFHYRHEWRERDLMIWDNRCLNHRVRSYAANDIRRRHRVTVAGGRPIHYE